MEVKTEWSMISWSSAVTYTSIWLYLHHPRPEKMTFLLLHSKIPFVPVAFITIGSQCYAIFGCETSKFTFKQFWISVISIYEVDLSLYIALRAH